MRGRRGNYAGLAMILLVAASGCGKLVKVKGTVTLDGMPVKDAVVLFEREGQASRASVGRTNSDGIFKLSTFEEGDGALPGNYRVTIAPPQAVPFVSDRRDLSFAEAMELYNKGLQELKNKPPPFGSGIPALYSDPGKTPLRQQVPPDADVVFALHSDPAAKPASSLKILAPKKYK